MRNPPQKNSGFALLLVIWTLALLAAIAAGVTAETRSDLAVARNLQDAARAEAAADGGVWRGVAAMLRTPDPAWRADGAGHASTLGESPLVITVQDEGGKLDLNLAEPTLFANLLAGLGVSHEQAQGVARAIDSARVRAGNKPAFAGTGALANVAGIDPGLATRLLPYVTVRAKHAGIDPALAPIPVLMALPGVVASEVAAYAQVRGNKPAGAGPLQDFSSLAADADYFSWSETGIVTVTATARSAGATFTRVAVVDLAGSGDRPYDVLAWGVPQTGP